ncbi:MAG: hypothetical protein AAGI37_06850 [Planctomycetota bacterium]
MPIKPRQTLRLIALLTVTALLFLPMAGCNNTAGVPSAEVFRATIEQARATSSQLDQVISEATAELEALPEGELRDEVLNVITKTTEEKARVDGVISELEARLASAGEDADALDAAALSLQTLGGTVPTPWGAYFTGLGGLLLAGNRWIKASRTKKAAERVVISIEQEKASNGGKIDFDDKAVKASLRSRMGTEAQELVEQARDKAGPLLSIGTALEPAA